MPTAKSSQSRRKKRRQGSGQMPMAGAGLMRFFEDSSIGIKIGPIATVLMASALILTVLLSHWGLFNWIFGGVASSG